MHIIATLASKSNPVHLRLSDMIAASSLQSVCDAANWDDIWH